jgi:hypothetical protein
MSGLPDGQGQQYALALRMDSVLIGGVRDVMRRDDAGRGEIPCKLSS